MNQGAFSSRSNWADGRMAMLNRPENTRILAEHCDALLKSLADGKKHQKDEYRRILVLHRIILRAAWKTYQDLLEDLRYNVRQKRLLQNQNISFLLLDFSINYDEFSLDAIRRSLIGLGEWLELLLDCRQEAGATREELFDLCGLNRIEKRKLQLIQQEDKDLPFSQLTAIYSLDLPLEKRGQRPASSDAPFTNTLVELWVDRLDTETGRAALDKAIEEILPKLWKQVLNTEISEWDAIKKEEHPPFPFPKTKSEPPSKESPQ